MIKFTTNDEDALNGVLDSSRAQAGLLQLLMRDMHSVACKPTTDQEKLLLAGNYFTERCEQWLNVIELAANMADNGTEILDNLSAKGQLIKGGADNDQR